MTSRDECVGVGEDDRVARLPSHARREVSRAVACCRRVRGTRGPMVTRVPLSVRRAISRTSPPSTPPAVAHTSTGILRCSRLSYLHRRTQTARRASRGRVRTHADKLRRRSSPLRPGRARLPARLATGAHHVENCTAHRSKRVGRARQPSKRARYDQTNRRATTQRIEPRFFQRRVQLLIVRREGTRDAVSVDGRTNPAIPITAMYKL